MSDAFRLKVVTPSGGVFDADVASVSARSEVGEFCVLPDHCRILSALEPGRMVVGAKDGARTSYAVDEGFLEGGADHVNVIVQRCVSAADIDEVAVKREKESLETEIASLDEADPERAERVRSLRWATARLEAVSG